MPGVLVTGGAGFIGSNLVDELMTQGHEVTVIDDFSEGKLDNLDRWRGNKKIEVVRGNICDFDFVRRAADHKDWVFHLAAMSRIQPSIVDPLKAMQTNVMGTANVLEAARQGGCKRFVYSASSSAYGRNKIPCVETMKPDCLNPYSLSKKNGEELVELYRQLYGMSTVSLRYFNVYGPRHQEDGAYATVIAIFRKQKRLRQPITVVGDGSKRRDFTFVSDVVRANMFAIMNREATGVINIGTGKNYSILEVAKKIAGEDGTIEHIEDRPAEAQATLADASRALELLGWRPCVNLDQGLEILDAFERRNSPGRIILV
jgi:UDP-glucose 4-epimerase